MHARRTATSKIGGSRRRILWSLSMRSTFQNSGANCRPKFQQKNTIQENFPSLFQ